MLLFQPSQPIQPSQNAYSKRGQRTLTDPLGLNTSPQLGAAINPFGEAFLAKSPAPITDPLGYAFGLYKPGSKLGKIQSQVNDPLGIFKGGLLRGLF